MKKLPLSTFLDPGQPLAELATEYLRCLLRYRRDSASELILRAAENKVSIKEIYLRVFEPCQYEIGRLWQTDQISVAQEHYCTAATQLIMSQLYPYIFRVERESGGTVVAACAVGELHELGARMLCDLLEMEGVNTIYLGANVPTSGIVEALQENDSHILAVSASMALSIPAVRQLVTAVRAAKPGTKVLVGGGAFNNAPNRWREVGADYATSNAIEAISIIRALHNSALDHNVIDARAS
jgi:MerR family transcriptional regulator, light-induced transcriptional regulator